MALRLACLLALGMAHGVAAFSTAGSSSVLRSSLGTRQRAAAGAAYAPFSRTSRYLRMFDSNDWQHTDKREAIVALTQRIKAGTTILQPHTDTQLLLNYRAVSAVDEMLGMGLEQFITGVNKDWLVSEIVKACTTGELASIVQFGERIQAKQAANRAKQHAALMHKYRSDRQQQQAVCDNPCFDAWLAVADTTGYAGPYDIASNTALAGWAQEVAADEWSYAVPCHSALQALVHWTLKLTGSNRIVDVGAGTGYWARLLQQYGAAVTAVDSGAAGREPKHFASTHMQDGAAYLRKHSGCSDAALFMCWPSRSFAEAAVAAYTGPAVIYVGEVPKGVVQGSTWAHDADAWELVAELDLPTWPLTFDKLYVTLRKAGAGASA